MTIHTSTPSTLSKSNEAALAEQLAAGTQKHLATIAQLIVGSSTYTPAQAETQLKAFAALRNDVDAARATVKAKLADEAAQAPTMRVFILAFITYVQAAFGNSPDILADFGLAPKKVAVPLTAVQKAAAAAKRKATREARGTMGKKARLAVKGNVTGIVVTPVTGTSSASAGGSASATAAPAPTQPAPATPAAPTTAPAPAK